YRFFEVLSPPLFVTLSFCFLIISHLFSLCNSLRNFLWNKKAGNARRKLLAYRSSACIETMRNGEDHFAQFPMV
ncbi:MAG: hypothetical protein IKM00_06715, partial [Clostridia bacterium]|nr:hypothetical protein [Clostridia bacterium]